jgi:hypothetical protein
MDLPHVLHRLGQWRRGKPEAEVVPFVEDLFRRYMAAGEHERRSIRQAVGANRALWDVGDSDINLYLGHISRDAGAVLGRLRGWLIAVSLTGGFADWRDTIVFLEKLRQEAEAQGIATRPHFEQIAATAESGDIHGMSEMSTRDLIWSGGGLTWFEGELREKAAALAILRTRRPGLALGLEAPQPETAPRPHRPWWRFF